MSETVAFRPVRPAWADLIGVSGTWTKPDFRRTLQLVLAAIWLLDGLLQLQAFFFTNQFGSQMIARMSAGNPGIVAHPIHWSGVNIAKNAALANTVFASVQTLLGLAIAWRPTVKVALAGSIVWSVGVWWIGEGLGGVLNGGADPVNGAPGAVIIYGLLAVLLWPTDRQGSRPAFVAAQAVGAQVAKGLWLVLWGSLAYFALDGANRSPQGLHDLISGQASGEPTWIRWIDNKSASLVAQRGLAFSIALAVLLAVVAIGVYLPYRYANAAIVVGALLGVVFWVVGQDFGTLFATGATDVNSGPLLMLLGAAYWVRPAAHPASDSATGSTRPLAAGMEA